MDLDLVIASTPKSGNTWLRYLLREVYRLPMVELPFPFNRQATETLTGSWIAQQHYFPTEDVLAWGEARRIVFLTTVRHPGDVLVSLYHYVRSYAQDPRWEGDPVGVMRGDREGPGANVIAYTRTAFSHYLELSARWIAARRSIVVRYEDLCGDPERELVRVVREVREQRPDAGLPLDRVAGAVASCEIGTLRNGLGLDPKFFRKGGSGSWTEELPDEVLEMFRVASPYPELFAALGYSADPALAPRGAPRAGSVASPFANDAACRDGTRIAPFLERLFLSLDDATRARLRPLAPLDDPGSFLAWLCEPAAEDPRRGKDPVVTNLAAAVHARRGDLQRHFPDPFGRDREAFAEWFLANVERDHGFDARLVAPVRASWEAWKHASPSPVRV